MPSGAPAIRCSSCTGSSTTASGDSFPSATFPTVDSSLRLDSAISVRACRRTRRQPPRPTRSPLCSTRSSIGRIDVIGESAGATSALQLALRHPERVKHLAVLVGNLPGSPTAVVQPSLAKLINRQLPLWALKTFAPSTMARLVAAVPKGFAMTSEDARSVTEFIDSLFPVSPEGFNFDALRLQRGCQRLQPGGHPRTNLDRPHQRRPTRLSRGE